MFSVKKIKSSELVGNEYEFKGEENIHAVIEGDVVKAYIQFEFHGGEIFLQMFEVIEKEVGYGTKIIQWLFENYKVEAIRGFCMKEERSYYFWMSMMAEIDLIDAEGYEVEELVGEGIEASFVLYAS